MRNIRTRKKRYLEFSEFVNFKPFPVTEFKLCKFATFLCNKMRTVESIKSYCAMICQENELRGYRPAKRGIKFYITIAGIKRKLRHQVKRAAPMTPALLRKINRVVDFENQKDMVTWVLMVSGYHLVLRKSNLVPLSRVHDMAHNITRSDVRYEKGVMMVFVRWSKMNQFSQKVTKHPLIANNRDDLCPVRWIMHMIDSVPAHPSHNLFSYANKRGQVVPVTYRGLMVKMRQWLKLVGVGNVNDYSSHLLHRGAVTTAAKANLSDTAIMDMGVWSSNCFRRYIEAGVGMKIKNWCKFSNHKQ